jgi:Anti-sigma-K factor rskA
MNATDNQPCPLNEQAIGWALHALEPDEEMAVLLHVPHCPSCRAVAKDAEGVLSHLGAAVEQVDPPPSLRNSLMAAVADTAQDSAPTTAIPVMPAPVVPPSRPRVPERVAPPSGPGRSRGSWLSRRRLVAASVALIAVIAVGGLAIRTTQLEQESQTLTARAQSIADLFGQLDRPGTKYALLASLKTGGTTAAVVVADGQRRVFSIGLPSNASDSTYVLWGLRAGAGPAPLGAFDVAPTDAGVQTVGGAAQSDGFTDYAVSIEPGRTMPTTPTEVLAKGSVKA